MAVLSTADIMAIIPHRPPMLMIDRVIHAEQDRGVGVKMVSAEDTWWVTNDDDNYMPQFLAIESMAQLAALTLVLSDLPQFTPERSIFGVLAGVPKMDFFPVTEPAEEIITYMEITKVLGGIARLEGQVFVGAELAAKGSIIVVMDLPDDYEKEKEAA